MPIYNPQLEQTATLIVAASDSLYPERADRTCDGTADDVEINAALALGAANTRVVLMDGTYTLADSIVFTNNNQMLEGQGRATFIDGDGLATTEHAIIATGLTNIAVKNLAIQTADGGGNTIHCIFLDDGCNDFLIDKVVIVDSDSDGIHVAGTNVVGGTIVDCVIEDVDDHGIYVDMDGANTAARITVKNNRIAGAGNDGLYVGATGAGSPYWTIEGNNIVNSGQNGIEVTELTYSNIVHNVIHTSTLNGILLAAGSNHNNVDNNQVYNNTRHGITIVSATENTLTGNNCNGNDSGNTNTYDGINLQLCDYTTLVGNHCYDNDRRGIQIGRSSYCVITGNNCHENTQDDGIYIIGDGAGNADYNVVSGNNCSNNGDDGIEVAQAGATANSNQITGNIVRGNSGTDIVDGGTLTVVKDNDGMVGFGDDQSTTLTVAASNSMQPANADYVCNGTADDVTINAALTALPAQGGRVILLEGTYTITSPIFIPDDDITLEGQGRSTFIDGDGLSTIEDAIWINARSNITIKNLAVQTQNGGGKSCQCISFNGPASGLVIDSVTIVDSDNQGIEIAGGQNVSDIRISNCIIEGADDYGIHINMDAGFYCDRLTIENCIITACGGVGIYFTGIGAGNRYCKVTNNTVYSCGANGIAIYEGEYGVIADNVCYSNTGHGIMLGSCDYATATGNTCYDNDSGGTTYSGLYISVTDNCTVSSNNCRANGLHGIYLRRSSNCTVTGNVCSGQNTGDGILVAGDATANSDYNTVSNNICEGNGDDGIEIAGGADANSNQVISNMLQGNSGTALVDGGTLTVVKDNEGMVGFGDDKAATLVVAASNSMQPANADYYCDNTADDVQINAALAALPAAGGKVVLLEGTYTLADPITIPANNIILEGLGEATFIDGDGLATGEHAILIPARTNCTICDLRIQTEDGGAKVCHCIYATGLCSGLTICEVTITDSDSDGIHIEPEDADDIHIHNCTIDDADDYGIFIDSPAGDENFRSHVKDCLVIGTGSSGIFIGNTGDGNWYAEVNNNLLYGCGGQGIQALEMYHCNLSNNICVASTSDGIIINGNHCGIEGNNCYNNGGNGIELATATECNIDGNVCTDNTQSGIELDGASNDNTLNANHCSENTLDGFRIGGYRDSIDGNFSHNNGLHGINLGNSDCAVTSNYIYDNSQTGAGISHGINIGADADRTQINDNLITDPGDRTEDGISLASGAVNCQICGNYIYNLMGDGIKLAGSNTSTLIKDNYCLTLDENGIVITDSADCTVSNNHCENNTHHGIYLDNVDEANVNNNYCRGNDRLNAATYDGIYVDVDSSYVNIVGNHCTENDRYGIYVLSVTCELTANHALTNTTGQISAAAGCVLAHNETGATAEVHEPREATIVVAASDSLTASADYVCDGTADEVQINAALNALPTDGGRVILLEGTFVTANTITIPDDSITLEGQGRATLIDGDGLAAAVNAITISAKDDVVIKNLAVQTQTGAEPAKGHCVYGENGCDRLLIENVTVVDSGDDGIHLTGTITYDVRIIGCNIMDGDGHGIYLAINPAYRFSLRDNTVKDVRDYGIYIGGNFLGEVTGNNVTDATQAGIFAWAGVNMIITNNTCRSCGTYGIYLNQCPTNTIMGNVCVSNTSHGMYVFRCLYCVINGNMCYGNGTDGINVTGDATHNCDYNTLTGNVCTGNADDGIAIEGVGDANKNIVVANNLFGNTGTNFVDNGQNTQIGHNCTA